MRIGIIGSEMTVKSERKAAVGFKRVGGVRRKPKSHGASHSVKIIQGRLLKEMRMNAPRLHRPSAAHRDIHLESRLENLLVEIRFIIPDRSRFVGADVISQRQ